MKRFARLIMGVTLLEVMLVLAVAAMIIVMSVRYYQSASASQQANSIIEQLQSITAAADGLAQATGSYSQGGVSSATLAPLLPSNSMTTPWGTAITITSVTGSSYGVSVDAMPSGVCPLVKSKLATNNHYVGASTITCNPTSTTTFTYTYTANP